MQPTELSGLRGKKLFGSLLCYMLLHVDYWTGNVTINADTLRLSAYPMLCWISFCSDRKTHEKVLDQEAAFVDFVGQFDSDFYLFIIISLL